MSSSFRMVNDQSAKESSSIGPNRIADALLTRMSIPPGEVRRGVDPPPGALLGGQVDRRDRVHPPAAGPDQRDRLLRTVCGCRSQPTTWAPSRAQSSAVARPIPPPVPEMSARLPSSRPMRPCVLTVQIVTSIE